MRQFSTLLLILVLHTTASAKSLTVAPVFADNMVLQANKKIVVWGRMQPNATVLVNLGGKQKKVKANGDGVWKAILPKRRASSSPITLEISSSGESLSFKNIIIGELWLCIGQYNMIFPMKEEDNYQQESKKSDYPDIRFFTPLQSPGELNGSKEEFPDHVKLALKEGRFYYKGAWIATNKKTLPQHSALAFYFAKILHAKLQVPIGIINLAVEGSPIESWIDEQDLRANRHLAQKASGIWLKNSYLPLWSRYIGAYNLYGKSEPPAKPEFIDHPYKPGYLFQTGVVAIKDLAIRGVLAYQGETNADSQKRTEEYAELSKLLINSYRKKWQDDKLPFYFVQLPSIDSKEYANAFLWPEFRYQQWRSVLDFKNNIGIVPSYDLEAESTVPTNKKIVSERLAALTLAQIYHQKSELYPPAPYPTKAVFHKDGVIVSFASTGSGLEVLDGDELRGFSLNGSQASRASIYQNTKVFVETNKKPKFVYYAWSPNATHANLANGAKIPAIAFKIKVQ